MGYCSFWWYFNTKVWSVDHIITVMLIIEFAIRVSAEKSRIHTQWWHFLRLLVIADFDDVSIQKGSRQIGPRQIGPQTVGPRTIRPPEIFVFFSWCMIVFVTHYDIWAILSFNSPNVRLRSDLKIKCKVLPYIKILHKNGCL